MSYQPSILESELLDGLNVRYLKLTGLWATINHQRTTGKKNLVLKMKVIASIFVCAPYTLFQFIAWFVIPIDLQKATFLTLDMLIVLQLITKLSMNWFRMDSICRLFDLARKDFLAIPGGKRPQVEQIFKKITKKSEKISLIILAIYTFAFTIVIAFPPVPVDYIAHRTGSMAAVKGGRKKIRGGWYPVPMDQSPYFEVIFAYEALAAFWGGILINLYICFFYQLLMCLYAQFTVLGYHLSTLKVEATDRAKRTSDIEHHNKNTEMNKELYAILKDHQKLLSYANELRSLYNPLVTIILGMGIAVLVIIELQFLFAGVRSPRFLLRSLIYLAFQSVEVCLFCFSSSSIEAVSSDLQFAIYSSDWYKADLNFRKSAQMLMVRARRGVTLTAIKMYPVNVETIMAILQFTYSVTTLMSGMA